MANPIKSPKQSEGEGHQNSGGGASLIKAISAHQLK
jgi:hypothetical protein